MKIDDGYTRYTLRIPTDLYERVKRASGEKSVNAEILSLLLDAYPPEWIDVVGLSTLLNRLTNIEDKEKVDKIVKDTNLVLSHMDGGWFMNIDPQGIVTFRLNEVKANGPLDSDEK